MIATAIKQLAGPRGYRRIDALLSSEDAAGAVAALSPNEVFELVHEVGFEDSQALIELATPGQIQGCFDLDFVLKGQVPLDQFGGLHGPQKR